MKVYLLNLQRLKELILIQVKILYLKKTINNKYAKIILTSIISRGYFLVKEREKEEIKEKYNYRRWI